MVHRYFDIRGPCYSSTMSTSPVATVAAGGGAGGSMQLQRFSLNGYLYERNWPPEFASLVLILGKQTKKLHRITSRIKNVSKLQHADSTRPHQSLAAPRTAAKHPPSLHMASSRDTMVGAFVSRRDLFEASQWISPRWESQEEGLHGFVEHTPGCFSDCKTSAEGLVGEGV